MMSPVRLAVRGSREVMICGWWRLGLLQARGRSGRDRILVDGRQCAIGEEEESLFEIFVAILEQDLVPEIMGVSQSLRYASKTEKRSDDSRRPCPFPAALVENGVGAFEFHLDAAVARRFLLVAFGFRGTTCCAGSTPRRGSRSLPGRTRVKVAGRDELVQPLQGPLQQCARVAQRRWWWRWWWSL